MEIETTIDTNSGIEPAAASQRSKSESNSALKQKIPVARWVIFFQAGLLGVTATTFFIFGLMVGNVTAPKTEVVMQNGDGSTTAPIANYVGDCRIAGEVMIRKRNGLVADTGAVVMALPVNAKPAEKQDPSLVMPDRFVALDNPAIEAIHESGGAIARADRRGQFELLVDQNRKYVLIVISKNKPNHPDRELTKNQTDLIGTFFVPNDKLVRGKEIFWKELVTDQDRIEQPLIEF